MRPTGWDAPELKPLRVWLNPEHGPALLLAVSPRTGLLPGHFAQLADWAATVG